MSVIAKKHTERVEDIIKNVIDWRTYFKDNVNRFYNCKRFVFQSNLGNSEKALLQSLGKPEIESNILEAYISRLLGEFSKQEPSFKATTSADTNQIQPLMIDFYEGKLREIWHTANKEGLSYTSYQDSLGGGMFAWRIRTEYEDEYTFDQRPVIEKIDDIGLVGFDPLARKPHKGDGGYVYEFVPVEKEKAKDMFPNVYFDDIKFGQYNTATSEVQWGYKDGTKEIVMVLYYYEKQKEKFRLFKLPNGMEVTEDQYKEMKKNYETSLTNITMDYSLIAQFPEPVKIRKSSKNVIYRYTIFNKRILDVEETEFEELPIIFGDGNSTTLADVNDTNTSSIVIRQVTRPYIYQAMDVQRAKNFALQTMGQQIQNMTMSQYMAPIESMDENYMDDWLNPQKSSINLYRAFDVKDPTKIIPPPSPMERTSVSPEILGFYSSLDSTIQQILGSYDAALGINNNQLSGVAIIEGATQSNASAMPYVVNFMLAMNQASKCITSLIPKLYVMQRNVGIRTAEGDLSYMMVNHHPQMDVSSTQGKIHIDVESTVNFEVQKMRSLNTVMQLGQAFPSINGMINALGMEYIFDNVDIRNVDKLKEMSKEWTAMQRKIQQQQMAQGMQNPIAQKMQLEREKMQQDGEFKVLDFQMQQYEQQLKAQDQQLKRMQIILDAINESQYNKVQSQKVAAEVITQTRSDAHKHASDAVSHIRENLKTVNLLNNNKNKEDKQKNISNNTQ